MDDPALLMAVAVGLVFAGCLGGGGSQTDTAGSAEAGTAEGTLTGNVSQGAERPNATLAEAPTWEIGDWWTVEIVGDDASTQTVTQVVADRHQDTYHVGLAADDFSDQVVLEHWPPLGEIGADLTWSVHNTVLDPFHFPLEEGKSWQTPWWGNEGHTAEVLETDGTEATLHVDVGEGDDGTYTYDAEMETITTFQFGGEVIHRVTDHGTGFEGEVVVPHGRIQHVSGRAVGAFTQGEGLLPADPAGLGQPAGPTDTLEVDQPDASVAQYAGSVPVEGTATPGLYRETATDPDGETFQLQTTGTEGPQQTSAHSASAEGSWQLEHVAGGAGFVATEIVAYDQLTVTIDGNATAEGT